MQVRVLLFQIEKQKGIKMSTDCIMNHVASTMEENQMNLGKLYSLYSMHDQRVGLHWHMVVHHEDKIHTLFSFVFAMNIVLKSHISAETQY